MSTNEALRAISKPFGHVAQVRHSGLHVQLLSKRAQAVSQSAQPSTMRGLVRVKCWQAGCETMIWAKPPLYVAIQQNRLHVCLLHSAV